MSEGESTPGQGGKGPLEELNQEFKTWLNEASAVRSSLIVLYSEEWYNGYQLAIREAILRIQAKEAR